MMIELSEEMKQQSELLAREIINACQSLPPTCGIAALIAVAGSVCFNEAFGDVDKAMIRAGTIAAGIKDVINKLHQAEQGNGPLDV